MAAKKKPSTEKPLQKNSVNVRLEHPDEDPDFATARVLTQPEIQAAVTIQQWQGNDIDVNQIAKALKIQTAKLKDGDMQQAESMLLSQAQTLNDLFNFLARRSHKREYFKTFEAEFRLALKAQSQSRATLETLSNIKNPPVVYAKQANISHGPQQVNNGTPAIDPRAEKTLNQPNELLEVQHGERLDSGTAQATSGSDQAMAAVG